MWPHHYVTGAVIWPSVAVVIQLDNEVLWRELTRSAQVLLGLFSSLTLNEYMTHLMDKMPCVKTQNTRLCNIIACSQKAFKISINSPFFFLILAQCHADGFILYIWTVILSTIYSNQTFLTPRKGYNLLKKMYMCLLLKWYRCKIYNSYITVTVDEVAVATQILK